MALHDVHELQAKDERSMVQQSRGGSKAKLSLDEARVGATISIGSGGGGTNRITDIDA